MPSSVSRSGKVRALGRRPLRRLVGLGVAVVLAGGLFQVTEPAPASAKTAAGAAGVAASAVGTVPLAKPAAALGDRGGSEVTKPPVVTLPGSADLDVAVPALGVVPAAGSVVSLGSLKDAAGKVVPGQARVEVLDRAQTDTQVKGAPGAAMAAVRVTPAEPGVASVGVRVDFSGFAQAYGAGYASRLQLYSVPSCFTVTPDELGCQLTPLASNRNLVAKTIEAAVPVAQPDTKTVPVEPETPSATPAATAPAVSGAAASETAVPKTAVSPASTVSPAAAASAAPAAGVPSAAADPAAGGGGQAMVLVAASSSGSSGDFKATPLQASGSWETGLNSGNFHYTYPIEVPPTVGGDTPDLALTYDSQSVDGRTTETNGQVSWAGQGWELQTGFIERRFRTCRDDGQTVDDLCWGGSPYVMSINGQSHDMIPAASGTPTVFRLRDDPGWLITRKNGNPNLPSSTPGLDDNDGEYFDVRSPDGMRYFFGWGKTPWASSNETRSVWTTTVFGDDSGEPCYNATFANARCQQAWRWNLDIATDRRGNTTAYTYLDQQNRYAVRGSVSVSNLYNMGGFVREITYGALATTGLQPGSDGGAPTSRVFFDYADRCTDAIDNPDVNCSPSSGTAAQWPDTPVDLICSPSASSCATTLNSPTFFTTVRLADIKTSRRSSPTASWTVADMYVFTQAFLNPDGGTETAELWLKGVQRTGFQPGVNVTNPPTSFYAIYLNNRVDPASGEVALSKPRIEKVSGELGNLVTVTYGHAGSASCTSGTLPGDPAGNQKECFPRWWAPPGQAAKFSWFHKYVVLTTTSQNLPTGVILQPTTAATEYGDPQVTNYSYQGGAAWHHDDDVNTPDDKQSWSDWRGYKTVFVGQKQVVDGIESSSYRTFTGYTFYRGMYGDQNSAGGTKSDAVSTIVGGSSPDYNYFRGRQAEMTQYSDNGTTAVRRVYTGYSAFRTADTVEHTGFVTRDAYRVTDVDDREWWINGSSIRKTKTVKTVFLAADPQDLSSGLVTQVEDQGDEAVTTDTRCTKTDYIWNTTYWLVRPARSEAVKLSV